jgi:hypothetical protein
MFSTVLMTSVPVFTFFASVLIFGGTEGIGSRFHVLRSRTHFRRYRVRRVPFSCFALPVSFSCFALPDSFSDVPRASGPVFIYYAPVVVFGGTEGVGSRVHVLHSRTHFRQYRVRRVPFSCFALPDSFSAVPRASRPVFMFFAPGLFFSSTEGFRSCFHVLRPWTRFWRYGGSPVSFSCFALPDSFSAVTRASGLVFIFYAPGLIYGGTEGVRSRFNVFRSRTCFWGCRGRRVSFSRLALPESFSAVMTASGPVFISSLPDSFSTVPRASGPAFMFSQPDSFSTVPRASGPVLMFCAPRTRSRRYRGRRVPFSCFALPDSSSAVPSASGPVFFFFVPQHVFGGNEGVGTLFHVLRSRTHFRRYRV